MKFTRQLLLAAGVFALAGAGVNLPAQTSDTNSLPCMLDLKPVYKIGANGTHKGYSGRKTVDGLPFEATGEAVLYGKSNADRNHQLPQAMDGIKVGCAFDELHLLHSVQWREYFGCPVATIRLHYADGTTNDFPIRFNFQVNDWNRLLSEEQEIIADPDTKIVWRGDGIYQGKGRLFKSVLRNPFPAKTVETLDVISTGSRASYVLVAATVAKSDPQREVTAPLPLEPSRNFDGVLKVIVLDDKTSAPITGVDVDPSMSIDNDGVVADPILTDSNGVALVKYPASRTAYVSVQVSKGDYARRNGNWQTGDIPAEFTVRLGLAPKISGIVHLPDGRPAIGIEVQLIGGGYGGREKNPRTDENGKFEMTLRAPLFEQNNNFTPCLLIRDPDRNLAVAQELEEETATLDLKLAPALTLVGHAECDGKPVTNATAQLVFWTGRSGMWMPGLARTNIPGQFEIPALPPGRKYGVIISAPGYGQKQNHNLEISAEPGRQELDTVELTPANLKLAGQVLDADDKPVTNCSVNLNGDGQPSAHTNTDREGQFVFEHVCAGSASLFANSQNSYGNVSAEGGDTNVVLRLGESYNSSPGTQTHKLTGAVTDADGKPDAGAQVAVFPNNNGTHWIKTDANGEFKLNWSLQPWQAQNGGAYLVVRDAARDLAAVEELPEETTNLNVKLKPALTLAGLVKNETNAPLPGAQIGMWFKAGNSYESVDEQIKPANAEGRFEIKCLPAEGKYIVWASAKGYGKSQLNIENESETNRVELEPFVLKLADRVIAGQVLRDDDKPAAGVNVNLNGEGQPDGYMTTDSKGRFHFQVCEGQIRLFAYSPNGGGGNAQATAEAGDTNIVMNLTSSSIGLRETPRRASLKGNALPDLTSVNLTADAAPANQAVLLCLFDASQRPSRHVVNALAQQAGALKQKNVSILAVQSAVVGDDVFNDWKSASAISIPVGRVVEKTEKNKWAANVTALPWLILADANHRVIAEGFPLDELDAQLQKLAK